eukprot:gene1604-16064_t
MAPSHLGHCPNTFVSFMKVITVADSNKYTDSKCTKDENGQEFCEKPVEEEDDEPCVYEDPKESLFQWDPVEVGYVRELELEEGKNYKMITKALRPRLFEIPDFLTEDECEHIIAMAESSEFVYVSASVSAPVSASVSVSVSVSASVSASISVSVTETVTESVSASLSALMTVSVSVNKDAFFFAGRSKAESNVFYKWDKNKDGVITAEDVKKFAVDTRYLYLEDQDIVEMFKELNITEIDDGKITEEEFETLNTDSLNEYLKNLRENHPRFRDRFSEQTWLQQGRVADPIMRKIKSRVQRLTKLSKRIIDGSEQLQVVHYNVNGHYHAHFDGQSKKQFGHLECCHFVADGKTECRLCRYITILYYLNDVEEGGETAFPVADSENYTHSDFQMRKDGDFFNLSKFCHNATSLVAPKRGKAVMWYNHHVDEHGWLGERDDHSLHGGCDIIKGEKWVANNWITAPEVDSYHRTSLYALADHILAGLEV